MKKSTLGLAVLLSVVSMQAFAAEQTADKTYYFDEVVVTASGKPETLFTTKSNTQVITAEQIEKMNYKSVTEAVRNVSGVQISDYGMYGHEISNGIRINGSNKVVVMIDGVRASMMGSERAIINQIMNDMGAIERIEVVKGSASVLYGSEAVGGVINIITKKADKFKTTLGVEGGSFNHENYKIAHQGKVNNTSYRVFAEKYHDGAYNDADGYKWDNRRNGHDESVNITHEFSKGNVLSLDYRHAKEDFGYIDNEYVSGSYYSGYNKGDLTTDNFVLRLDNRLNEKISNKFSYAYSKYVAGSNGGESSAPGYWAPWGDAYKSNQFKDVFTYANKDNVLSFGVEYIKTSTIDEAKYGIESGKFIEDKSIFVQDNWKFAKGWNLTAGLRMDDAKTSSVDMNKNWAKSINLGYEFTKNTNAYIGYNDYFVLPTMGQLYNTKYGNDSLDAAKGKNYEIGLNHKFTPNDVVSVHYFHRKADKNINYVGSYPGGTYVNSDANTIANGYDIQYDKTFDGHWHSKISWSHLKTEEETMGYLPSNQFTLGVDYTADKWNVGMDVRAFVGRNGKDVNYDAWPQGGNYFLADLGVNYKPTKNGKIYLKINNIFNKLYAEQTGVLFGSDGYWTMPGRTFMVGMNWSF